MDQPAATPPSSPTPAAEPFPSTNNVSPLGGLLSYLVPGLGQIVQGRTAKGILFFACVYILFFYGLYLGAAEVKVKDSGVERTYRVSSNVFLPTTAPIEAKGNTFYLLRDSLYNRPQFLGQFWVGIVAWPALAQYAHFDRAKEDSLEEEIDRAYKTAADLGMENPEGMKQHIEEAQKKERSRRHPLLGDIMREPTIKAMNAVHNGSDKRLEVAWVFTVIAGVLNILVIFDAFAGPAYPERDEPEPSPEPSPEPKQET